MKYLCLLTLILLTGCSSCGNKTEMPNLPAADLLQAGNVKALVAKNHQNLRGVDGDFESFKEYLNGLKDDDAASIPYAMDYIKTCLPSDMAGRDSVVLLFNVKFFKITNFISSKLETRYAAMVKLYDGEPQSAKLRIFKNNLKTCGIGIFQTEGNCYLDVLPDYFYTNFKNRVSAGVKEYLNIRRVELAQGFSEDAGLLISYRQLYQRVKRWEKYMKTYPTSVYRNEAENYYTTYLETLLTGMDNSPVFEGFSETLSPEVKAIYEQAILRDPESPSSKIITYYYGLLSRNDFRRNDSIPIFLNEHKLSNMSGIQPDTR
ncbi:hypothetical protein HQ865_06075 [Mucilaginibacter mali]|uniref:Uncharacterized protein n=1 Tax=Mucilaginibacter mali TaxID=2740462 RepID=A0A7D4UNU0_9SPHI|nr:hypothetical protein [Mucilaginibacter mali]QKJ29340.1 hypothetical protein HQ865_06075 [Mucilaginibacter mali]